MLENGVQVCYVFANKTVAVQELNTPTYLGVVPRYKAASIPCIPCTWATLDRGICTTWCQRDVKLRKMLHVLWELEGYLCAVQVFKVRGVG
jgi:hypothetical protein